VTDATVSAVVRPRALPSRWQAGAGVGSALALTALGAADGGYFPTAWGWAALVGLWLVAAVVLLATVVRPSGLQLAFLGGVAGLTVWTWLSAVWSIDAVDSVHEGQRMLVYLAAAAALVLVVRGTAVAHVLGGALAGIALISFYSLATRLFPDRLGVFDPVAGYRLSEPVGYWNGLGIFAAVGVLLAVGLAVRARTIAARALAGALAVLLVPTVYFTFGRGPWIALGLAILAAVALEPRRLQLVSGLLIVGVPAAAAVFAASHYEALRREDSPLALAAGEGRRLAVVLVGLALLGALAAAAFAVLERRVVPTRSVRRAFAAALVLAALAGLATVFVRYGGPVTLADKAYDSFNAPPPGVSDDDLGERLFSFSGSYRVDLWKSAWRDYREHPVLGSGSGSYEQHWLRDRPFEHKVRDAHNLYLETLAELGPLGLVLLLVALGAPVVAAVVARRHPLTSVAFAAYAAYLVHAAVDWDWELPALTVSALICASVLLVNARREERLVALTTRTRGAAAAAAFAVAAVAFVTLTGNSAVAASDEAAEAGNWKKAAAEARKAKRWAPWSSEPWQRLGEAHLGQGAFAEAERDFREALEREPGDFELWLDLARATDGPERTAALARAEALNPLSPEIEEFRAG
jgi:O-Antigen ligase/Tetratricopeptide repeat